MTISLQRFGRWLHRPGRLAPASSIAVRPRSPSTEVRGFEIPSDDPINVLLHDSHGPIEVDKLTIDSPTLRALKSANVKLAFPLISQGELIGLLNLGPRLSEQDYSADDMALLNNLAMQAAPAVRVAQLVQQREAEALELERVEQELRVARLIQQTLLPKELPVVPGWQLAVHYQPARAVGGDFYDFFKRPDGRLVLVVGDVTDKGVPAALVMATTRSILRGTARRLLTPGAALERANSLLCPEIPANMFVTCLYAILDPRTGHMRFANAGHDLPIRESNSHVTEFRATGMPLGLMPDMTYEENEGTLSPGDSLLLYSDGLVEAHNAAREMFGFQRLRTLLERDRKDKTLIEFLLDELAAFAGRDWEQEDDVTLLTLRRDKSEVSLDSEYLDDLDDLEHIYEPPTGSRRRLVDFSVPSEQGNEIQVMEVVADAARDLGLPESRLERLKTAVAEAAMNAMEHGNKFNPARPVYVRVMASRETLAVYITDEGGGRPIPNPHTPDLEAKLAGREPPRGWGLFLIQNLVDEMHITSDDRHHTVELIMRLEGGTHGGQAP